MIYRTRNRVVAVEPTVHFTADEAWTGWKVRMHSYRHLSGSAQTAVMLRHANTLAKLRGLDCHLIVAPSVESAAEWRERLLASTPNPQPGFERIIRGQAEYIDDVPRWVRNAYLLVKLGDRVPDSRTRRLHRKVRMAAGWEHADADPDEVKRWAAAADRLNRAVGNGDLVERRLEAPDVAWLIRRGYWRGSIVPPLVDAVDGHPPRRYGRGRVEHLGEAEYVEHPRWLEQTYPQHMFLSWLTIDEVPDDELPFPGGEWLYHPGVPYEVSARFRLEPKKRLLAKVRRGRRMARSQDENRRGTGEDLPPEIQDAYDALGNMQDEVAASNHPTVEDARVRLLTWGRDVDELDSRVGLVRDAFEQLGIVVQQPADDQAAIHAEAAVGGKVRRVFGTAAPFEQRMPLRTLTGSMFSATDELGDNTGPLVGFAADGQRVHWRLHQGVQADPPRPPGVAITGKTRKGKSHLAFLLAVHAWQEGSATLVIDPGNSAAGLVDVADRLGLGEVKLRTLGERASDAGALDPYALATSDDEAVTLATAACQLLLPLQDALNYEQEIADVADKVARRKAHQDVIDGDPLWIEAEGRPSLTRVADGLAASRVPEVARIGRSLQTASRNALGRYYFGRHDTEPLQVEAGMTILHVRGMETPDADLPRDHYTAQDRLAVTGMFLVAQFAKRMMVQLPRDVQKAIVIDEGHAVVAFPQGRRLVSDLYRMGGKENAVLVFVTQNNADIGGPEMQANIGVRCAFHADYDSEVAAVLAAHGLEDSEANRLLIPSLGTGQCMFTSDGKSGVLNVDLTFEQFRDAFSTTARRAPAVAGG